MTLSQIMKLALRQLDEDAEDVSEYEELFKVYANTGYAIAVRGYLRPREMRELVTDEQGRALTEGMDVERVIELTRAEAGAAALERVPFIPLADGSGVRTQLAQTRLYALCEVRYPEMTEDTDEPRLPEDAHAALADYICYRHLSSGSLAKQSRAKFFLTSFYQAMQRMLPAGAGSVTTRQNLYEATRLRAVFPR